MCVFVYIQWFIVCNYNIVLLHGNENYDRIIIYPGLYYLNIIATCNKFIARIESYANVVLFLK